MIGVSPSPELAASPSRYTETAFQIPSYTGFIAPTVDRIVRKIRKARCIPGKEADVQGALFEALANAVVHGNHEDVKKPVRIRVRYEPKKCLSIIVSDEGSGFDPGDVADPTRPENVEREHGRGILLMKAFMDEVHYEKNGTEVHLVKNCDAPVRTFFKDYAARVAHYVRSKRARRKRY
jgi:serine/threonine-protein kinase RsbW